MLEEMEQVLVLVTDVNTGRLPKVDTTIQKLLILLRDANIQFVLLVFIAAIQENVQVVKDVHRMLMVITYLTFVPLVDREVDHKHHGQLYVPLVGAVA